MTKPLILLCLACLVAVCLICSGCEPLSNAEEKISGSEDIVAPLQQPNPRLWNVPAPDAGAPQPGAA